MLRDRSDTPAQFQILPCHIRFHQLYFKIFRYLAIYIKNLANHMPLFMRLANLNICPLIFCSQKLYILAILDHILNELLFTFFIKVLFLLMLVDIQHNQLRKTKSKNNH